MDAIYRALARIDTCRPAAYFTQHFEELLLCKAQGTLTLFISPNQYDDFVTLLLKYRDTGNPFVWFYPVSGHRELELPPALEKEIEVIPFEC